MENKEPKIITIAQNKGGVGKTTTAINLASGLSKRGHQVLLIDLDSQASLTRAIGLNPNEYKNKCIMQVLQEFIDIKETCKDINDNLDIIPSYKDLVKIDASLSSKPYILQDQLGKIKSYYDYIIIDTPPSMSTITKIGLVASTDILIPIQCEYMALEQTTELIETIEQYKKDLHNDSINISGILLTMYNNTSLSKEIERLTREYFNDKCFNTKIRRNVKIAEAPAQKISIYDYDNSSTGAEDYKALVEELLARYNK